MSETYSFEEIPQLLGELNDNWRQGPWDREVTLIQELYYKEYSKWHTWRVTVIVDEDPCEPRVQVKEGELVLWGGNSSVAGQVEKWTRRVALLVVLTSSSRFAEVIEKI